MSQAWPVTLYESTEQAWPVTLWDGEPPSEGYLWYDVDVEGVDAYTRPFAAPLDASQVTAPLDISNVLEPLDASQVTAPLDISSVTAPLDMETEVPD